MITLFLLVPLLFPIALSFSDTPFVVFPPQGFTLQWYWKVLNEPDFTTPFWFSVQLGLFSADRRAAARHADRDGAGAL